MSYVVAIDGPAGSGKGTITPSSTNTTKSIGWSANAHHSNSCLTSTFSVSAWKCTNCSTVFPKTYNKTCSTCGAVIKGGSSSFSSAHPSCTCKTCNGTGVV